MRTSWLLAALIATVGPARASSSPAFDVVVRHDGSVLQGHVAELIPGESVTLLLLSGETRTIPWDEIESTRGPTFPTPPPPPDPNLQPGPGRVPLLVESSGAPLTVGAACQTPCKLYVPPGLFGLATSVPGEGTTNTALEVPPGGMRVRLSHGSSGGMLTGTLLLWPGIGLLIGGVATSVVGAAENEAPHARNSSMAPIGYGLLGVGAVALTTSIVLMLTSRRRVVERRALTF